MIAGGLEAYVACVDPRKLPARFAGRRFDAALLAELPAGVDPCAENGEFHTFASAGPMFRSPVAVEVGETVTRDGFVFCDLVISAQAADPRSRVPNYRCDSGVGPRLRGEDAREITMAQGPPRIVSLIASATEIVCALGARRPAGGAQPRMRLSRGACCSCRR